MKATTIDNFNISAHERYAQDQKVLDKTFITEALLLSPSFDKVALSSIYSSKWEELFEMGIKNLPWAVFSPPSAYRGQPNRFFSYRILPSIFVEATDEDGEGEERDEDEEKKESEILKKVQQVTKGENEDTYLFERDKSAVINLLETVHHLNHILLQINSRKLQYQKG